jgi:hypothetical protein
MRPGEELVCGEDCPYFPAVWGEPQLIAVDRDGTRHFAVTPRFRRAVAEWVVITAEAVSSDPHFRWNDADLLIIDDAAAGPGADSMPAVGRVQPDDDGRYFFEGWLWNVHDGDGEQLDDVARAALTLLTQDRTRLVAPLIRYVAEHTHLHRIRRRCSASDGVTRAERVRFVRHGPTSQTTDITGRLCGCGGPLPGRRVGPPSGKHTPVPGRRPIDDAFVALPGARGPGCAPRWRFIRARRGPSATRNEATT